MSTLMITGVAIVAKSVEVTSSVMNLDGRNGERFRIRIVLKIGFPRWYSEASSEALSSIPRGGLLNARPRPSAEPQGINSTVNLAWGAQGYPPGPTGHQPTPLIQSPPQSRCQSTGKECRSALFC